MDSHKAEGQKLVSIPKETVKTLALQYGLREAARRLGLNENTVLQWSNRDPNGPWKVDKQARNQNVITPSQATATALQEDSDQTKIGLSQYAKKQAQHLATKGKLKDHGAFRNLTAGSSQLHGWEEKSGNEGPLTLNLLSGQTVIQVGTQPNQESA